MPPELLLRREKELDEAEPEVNPWACLILLVVCVASQPSLCVFTEEYVFYLSISRLAYSHTRR